MDFPQLMPPTLISRDLDEINAFRDEHGAVVMKPLHGHGGAAVFRVMPQDMNFGSLFDMFSVTFREPWVIQRFLPEVKHGDKRIILVDGEFAGAVNRVPAADDLRSNMVRGGAAQATDLSPREREICATLGPALRERGLLFVGIDVIDGNLTEINVTSPTGIRAIARLGGPDVAAKVWDAIEAKRSRRNNFLRAVVAPAHTSTCTPVQASNPTCQFQARAQHVAADESVRAATPNSIKKWRKTHDDRRFATVPACSRRRLGPRRLDHARRQRAGQGAQARHADALLAPLHSRRRRGHRGLRRPAAARPAQGHLRRRVRRKK